MIIFTQSILLTKSRFANKNKTAKILPSCIATSKVLCAFVCSSPKNELITIKCPVEDIGTL
jgi:hypothetical protein